MKTSKLIAAAARLLRPPLELSPESEQERAAWEAYHATWEMDPPPDPRAVFLAGFRAAKAHSAEVDR